MFARLLTILTKTLTHGIIIEGNSPQKSAVTTTRMRLDSHRRRVAHDRKTKEIYLHF